jgi:hypothetical protein
MSMINLFLARPEYFWNFIFWNPPLLPDLGKGRSIPGQEE